MSASCVSNSGNGCSTCAEDSSVLLIGAYAPNLVVMSYRAILESAGSLTWKPWPSPRKQTWISSINRVSSASRNAVIILAYTGPLEQLPNASWSCSGMLWWFSHWFNKEADLFIMPPVRSILLVRPGAAAGLNSGCKPPCSRDHFRHISDGPFVSGRSACFLKTADLFPAASKVILPGKIRP
jgi:hypothetical protein